MARIGYYLFLKPLSMLPLPLLYGLTWPLYLILAYVVRYRKKVIDKNLRHSFPDKSYTEISELRLKFYRHFFDQILESLKMLSISEKEATRRLTLANPELLDEIYDRGQSVAMVMGHYNNWEFTPFMNNRLRHQFTAIYASLRNEFINEVIKKSRSFAGSEMVKRNDLQDFIRRDHPEPFVLLFAADQSPNMKSKVYWTTFLNQETGFATGTERYAKILDLAVVFLDLQKVKRGHYEARFVLITDQPKKTETGYIMERYVRLLEEQIGKAPEYWLWSHKRWKKKRKRA